MADLAALLREPGLVSVSDVPVIELPALLAAIAAEQVRLAAIEAAVAARMANGHGPVSEDRLLGVDDAAERLGVTRDWLRRRPELPFVVKLSEGVVRYSSRGLDNFIAGRVVSHT